jgi:hypothetical protein
MESSGGEGQKEGSVVAVDGVEVDEDEFSDGEIDAAAEAEQLQTSEEGERQWFGELHLVKISH